MFIKVLWLHYQVNNPVSPYHLYETNHSRIVYPYLFPPVICLHMWSPVKTCVGEGFILVFIKVTHMQAGRSQAEISCCWFSHSFLGVVPLVIFSTLFWFPPPWDVWRSLSWALVQLCPQLPGPSSVSVPSDLHYLGTISAFLCSRYQVLRDSSAAVRDNEERKLRYELNWWLIWLLSPE